MSADLSVSVDELHESEEVVCEIKQMDSSGSVCSRAAKCAATDDRPAESDRSVFVITKPAVEDRVQSDGGILIDSFRFCLLILFI